MVKDDVQLHLPAFFVALVYKGDILVLAAVLGGNTTFLVKLARVIQVVRP